MALDIATTRGLVQVHARYAQAFPISRFIRDRYFGGAPIVSKFPYVTIETMLKGRTIATQIRRGSNPNAVIARDGHGRTVYEPPYFAEKSAITAEDLTTFSFGESIETPYDSTTKALMVLAEKQQNILDRFSRTVEKQAVEILLNGKVTMVDGSEIIFANDTDLMGVNPSLKWDATTGTIDILGDLKTWMLLVRKKSGVMPSEIVVASDVHELIVNDSSVQNIMDVRNYKFGELTMTDVSGYEGVSNGGFVMVPGAGLLQIFVYTNFYDDGSDTVDMFPAGTLLMINNRNMGRMSYAALEGNVNGLPAYIPGEYYAPVSKALGDEDEAAITVKMAPLAQPISLNTWLSANVLTTAE
jgi:hypothetical protein